MLYGNAPQDCAAQQVRGQRVFCSNRGQRGGCGGTFSLFLADVLPRHSVRATLFWKLLCHLLAGASIKEAAESLRVPFALETAYGVVRRLGQRLDVLRACLCQKQSPPPSQDSAPLLLTVRHFQAVFAGAACPLSEFQLAFATPLMG